MQPHQLGLWADEHPPAPAAQLTTADAGRAFIAARAIKASSAEHYANTFRVLAAHAPALPASPIDIERFLAAVHVAPTTRDGYYRDLRAFYRWATSRLGVADAMLGVRRPTFVTPAPDILDADQVRRLLRTNNRRDRAIIAFALDTGARLSELTGVRRRDITTTTTLAGRLIYTVHLRGSAARGGAWRLKTGERRVPLSQPAAQLLTGIGAGDLLWTAAANNARTTGRARAATPLTAYGIQHIIRRVTRAELGHAYGPHALRHTFATMYLRAGGDVESLRRIMGHADVATTLIYLHLLADDLAEKHDTFSPIARATP